MDLMDANFFAVVEAIKRYYGRGWIPATANSYGVVGWSVKSVHSKRMSMFVTE
jgi:hypothetical protein